MLTRNDELTSPDKFISDNLTHKPDVSQSAYDNLSAGIATAPYAVKSFDQEFNESPRGKTVAATFEALKRGNENPEVGWTQWGVNEAANMLGQTLNPLGFMFAEVGGLAVRPLTAVGAKIAPQLFRKPIKEILGETMGKYFPETIGSELEKQTLSLGLFGKDLTKGFGIGAGAMLPQSVIDNFNAETGEHDILGIAKGMGAGGVFGMSIGTIPFAWGILKANVNRLRGRAATEKITPDEITKMVEEGVIDEDTAQFMKDMGMNVEPGRKERIQKFQERATKFVADQGHPVDHANDTAQFEILNRDQINNLQSATVDQLVSDNIPEEHRNALSDFTVQAGMDEMRNKPNLLDGVRGYVDYMDANLPDLHVLLSNADRVVEEHFNTKPQTVEEKEFPLSQRELYKLAKKIVSKNINKSIYADSNAIENLPFHMPETVLDNVYRENYIREKEMENEKLFKKYEETGDSSFVEKMKDNENQIQIRKEKMVKLLSPKEELKQLREDLFETKLSIEEPDYYHIAPETYQEGQALKSLFSTKGINGLKEFLEKWKYDLFEGDLPLVKKEIKVLKTHPKLVFLFKKGELDRAINWLKNNKGRVKTDLKKNKLLGIYDSAKELKTYMHLDYEAVPHEIPARFIKDITKELHYSGLVENYNKTDAFKRLEDLAEIWNPAKTLLDRINLEYEVRRQEAYRDLARQMLDIADSNVGATAKVENINGYMEARTKSRIDEHNPKAELIELAKRNEVPADADVMIAEHDRMVEMTEHEQTKIEYEIAKDKYNEFKKSENVFKNFINCVLGSSA